MDISKLIIFSDQVDIDTKQMFSQKKEKDSLHCACSCQHGRIEDFDFNIGFGVTKLTMNK